MARKQEKTKQKRLSPIERHSARISILFIFLLLLWGVCTIVIFSIFNLLNFPDWMTEGSSSMIGFVFMFYFCIKVNCRFGFIENMIEGRKKYKHFDFWFAEVNGKW